MKKALSILLIVAMVFAMVGCGSKDDGEQAATGENQPVTIVIGHASALVHPYGVGIDAAIEWLAENTDGTITIDHQAGGVLGGETACIESAILGDIQGSCGADMSYATFSPELYALNFPAVFPTYEDVAANYWNGWGREHVENAFAEDGLTLMAVFNNYYRWWSNNDHPVTTWDGMKGMKIRVPESEYMISMYEALGCQCVAIAVGELATALQQGVADAQELNPQSAYARGYHLYQKYWTESNAGYSAGLVAINTETYNSLTAEQQGWLKEAFAYGETVSREYSMGYLEECIEKAEADGCEFIRTGFDGNDALNEKLVEIGKEIATSAPYTEYFTEEVVAHMYG